MSLHVLLACMSCLEGILAYRTVSLKIVTHCHVFARWSLVSALMLCINLLTSSWHSSNRGYDLLHLMWVLSDLVQDLVLTLMELDRLHVLVYDFYFFMRRISRCPSVQLFRFEWKSLPYKDPRQKLVIKGALRVKSPELVKFSFELVWVLSWLLYRLRIALTIGVLFLVVTRAPKIQSPLSLVLEEYHLLLVEK